MPSSTGPSLPPPEFLDVEVHGDVPTIVSGRIVGIGHDGVVHSVVLSALRLASYRAQQLGTGTSVQNVLAFGGTILALSDDSPAHELSAELDAFRFVDLAGLGRVPAPFPKKDPITAELHLVAGAHDGTQSHTVVTADALTRSGRTIVDAPRRITDLALSCDKVAFVAPGFVGITPREGEARTTWIATNAPAPHPLHAHDAGETVVLLCLTPLLERWTLHAGTGTIVREVVDPTPRRFAHVTGAGVGGAPRWMWTTDDETIRRHDLVGSHDANHNVSPCVPGDFVLVPKTARRDETDGDWLVCLVHDPSGATTDLRVFDGADIAGAAVATVRIPRPIPHGLRCAWIPSVQH